MKTAFVKFATVIVALAAISVPARADDASPATGATTQPYVTWEQYQRLLREQKEMRQELLDLKKQMAAPPAPATGPAAPDVRATDIGPLDVRPRRSRFFSADQRRTRSGNQSAPGRDGSKSRRPGNARHCR